MCTYLPYDSILVNILLSLMSTEWDLQVIIEFLVRRSGWQHFLCNDEWLPVLVMILCPRIWWRCVFYTHDWSSLVGLLTVCHILILFLSDTTADTGLIIAYKFHWYTKYTWISWAYTELDLSWNDYLTLIWCCYLVEWYVCRFVSGIYRNGQNRSNITEEAKGEKFSLYVAK